MLRSSQKAPYQQLKADFRISPHPILFSYLEEADVIARPDREGSHGPCNLPRSTSTVTPSNNIFGADLGIRPVPHRQQMFIWSSNSCFTLSSSDDIFGSCCFCFLCLCFEPQQLRVQWWLCWVYVVLRYNFVVHRNDFTGFYCVRQWKRSRVISREFCISGHQRSMYKHDTFLVSFSPSPCLINPAWGWTVRLEACLMVIRFCNLWIAIGR